MDNTNLYMKKIDKIASDLYLELLVANDFPEQEPKHKNARWYDLFWLLIPIIGFLFFYEKIRNKSIN